jgi:16S rRNA (cytidine1402-2'-O)-methyltransferase
MNKKGKLYLLPSPLGENALSAIPAEALKQLHRLEFLIAEKAKTARQYIKASNPMRTMQSYNIQELNEHTPPDQIPGLLKPLAEGHDLGLLSEAGCPAVADPGAALVKIAHEMEYEVIPVSGPSSVFLALMASGMNGQRFSFHGYLSFKPAELIKDLKRLEELSEKNDQTQIFIETPYRNENLFETCLSRLSPDTDLCVAVQLTLPTQYIRSMSIRQWKKYPKPNLHKKPAVFLIYRGK